MKTLAQANAFTLYGTSACHLCELAEEMLALLENDDQGLSVEKVDISDSDLLFERYGVRIPVVRSAAGHELGWPFTDAQLRDFVRMHG
mgnify:FL=1